MARLASGYRALPFVAGVALLAIPASSPAGTVAPLVSAFTAGPVGSTFRISSEVPFSFDNASVAYNSVNNEYLVVWYNITAGISPNLVFEVFGQRIDGATGAEVGVDDFQISNLGMMAPHKCCDAPTVAYNSVDNEYLVVWMDAAALLHGQRLDGATGAEIGSDDFALTTAGVAGSPDLAFNPADEEYLLVYSGDPDGVSLFDDPEIYARTLDTEGVPLVADPVRVSDMGPEGESAPKARRPTALHNSSNGEYFVVWEGLDLPAPDPIIDLALYAQRLAVTTAAEVGVNDMQISNTWPVAFNGAARRWDATYNPIDNEYMVAWNVATGIRGQRLNAATGSEIGPNDFSVVSADSAAPAVAFGGDGEEYLVAFRGQGRPRSSGVEILGQRLTATGVKIGTRAFGISAMAPGDFSQQEGAPLAVYNPTVGEYLVVWDGDRTPGPGNNNNLFGRRVSGTPGAYVLDGFGGVHPAAGSSAASPSPPDFGFDVARDMESATIGLYVLDGFGGLHAGAGAAPVPSPTPYFGFDVAVDLELADVGYYVLDAFGGVHNGGLAPVVEPPTPYFGFDAARDLELVGGGVYVLDAFGGVHAGGGAAIIAPATPYFGFDIARDMEPVGAGGYYVLDGFGGVHVGGDAPPLTPTTPYFGFDAAEDFELTAFGYYVLDAYGGIHAGGGAPPMSPGPPYFGFDIARDLEIQ